MVDPKHFCHQATQPKMLALLKKTFIEPVGSSDVALRDRILSMDDGFEFLLRNRSSAESLEGVSKIFNLCTGRDFSPTYDTDPDFVNKLAQVRLPVHLCASARSTLIEGEYVRRELCDSCGAMSSVYARIVTLLLSALCRVCVSEVQSGRIFL